MSRPLFSSRSWRFLPALVLLAACAACSSDKPKDAANRKPVHPVKGQVFFGDKPAVGAFVVFFPAKEGASPTDPRPRATVGADGFFALSTYDEDDGAPAGDYLVTVTLPIDGRDDEDKLKGRYKEPAKSGLKATVKDGKNDLPAFKLK